MIFCILKQNFCEFNHKNFILQVFLLNSHYAPKSVKSLLCDIVLMEYFIYK